MSWPDQSSVSTGLLTAPINTVSSSAVDTYGGYGGAAGATSNSSNRGFDVVRVGSTRPHFSSSNSNTTASSVWTAGGSVLPAAAATPTSSTGTAQVAASIPGQPPGQPSLHVLPAQQQRQRRASSPQVKQLGRLQTQPSTSQQQQQPKLPPSPLQQQQQPSLPPSQEQQRGLDSSQQPAAVQKVQLLAVASLSDLLSQQPGTRSNHSRAFASYTGGSTRGGTGSGTLSGTVDTTDVGHGPQDL